MIEIYLKDNLNFENNGDITLEPTSCIYKSELNGLKEITLEHDIDELGRWKYIKEDNLISISNASKKRFYRIYSTVKFLDYVQAFARPVFYDLLDKVLLDVRPTEKNGQEALSIILHDTPFRGHSNISKVNTSYYIRKNIIEALLSNDENSFLNRWGGELYLDNWDIYLNDKVGHDNGVRIEFGYDLTKIEQDINIDDVVTRVIPVGYDGLMLYGNEPWVDSNLINKYSNVKTRVINFDDIKLKENNESDEGFDTIEEARNELIKRCKELFVNGIDKPFVNYQIELENLENTIEYKDYKLLKSIDEGDTVVCRVDYLDIDITTRCISIERNELTSELIKVELGNFKENFFNDQTDIKNKVENILTSSGDVEADKVFGIINAMKTKFKAQRDIAHPSEIRALIFEDKIKESPTYGAMCIGTCGFQIANKRTPDDKDWEWTTFGSGQGFIADLLVAGTILSKNGNSSINLDTGEVKFKKGLLEGLNMLIDITNGDLTTYQSGNKAIELKQGMLKLFNYLNSNQASGSITPVVSDSDNFGLMINGEKVLFLDSNGSVFVTTKNGYTRAIFSQQHEPNSNAFYGTNYFYDDEMKEILKVNKDSVKIGKDMKIDGNIVITGTIKNTEGMVLFPPDENDGDNESLPNEEWKNGIISSNGFRFIKGYEAFAPYRYKDSAGYDTIAYGVTLHGEPTIFNQLVKEQPLTEERAAKVSYDLKNENYGKRIINRCIELGIKEQKQFDALLSLAYNAGVGVILGDNSLTNAIKRNPFDYTSIRSTWEKFYISSNGQVLQGLVLRRKAEANIYCSNIYEKRQIPKLNSSGAISGSVTENNGDGWLPTSNISKGEMIIESARKLIGKPYVFGGNYTPLGSSAGTDCSGLCQWAYNDNNIKITRTTYTQINEGVAVPYELLQFGDLIFSNFSGPGRPEHVYMYSGKNQNGQDMCVEAPRTGLNIRERSFVWTSDMQARRILKTTFDFNKKDRIESLEERIRKLEILTNNL